MLAAMLLYLTPFLISHSISNPDPRYSTLHELIFCQKGRVVSVSLDLGFDIWNVRLEMESGNRMHSRASIAAPMWRHLLPARRRI